MAIDHETSVILRTVQSLLSQLDGPKPVDPEEDEDVVEPAPDSPTEEPDEAEMNVHLTWEGVITYEGVETGDGRLFQEGAVVWNEALLPFPFTWQRAAQPGHDGNVTIGRVDSIFRAENGEIRARGIILTGPDAPQEAQEYVNLLREGAAGGVSIDGDSAVFEIVGEDITDYKMIFSSINIRSLTAVAIPAFAGAKIGLSGECVEAVVADILVEAVDDDDESMEYSRNFGDNRDVEPVVAAGIPVDPPIAWFEDPQFSELTPITITDEGRIFGHLCGKETCHIGYGTCKTSPRGCDYDAYFHLGEVKCAEGDCVYVGHMTFGGGHAPLDKGAQAAAAYYDSTSRVSADIRCGEDEHGTWVAGALRPSLSAEDIREIRSAPLSGDWRPIKGKLQLIAAHAVNVPGFPVPRAKVMVASGVTETIIITDECNCTESDYWSMMFEIDLDEIEG